jgi:hypothetical protein
VRALSEMALDRRGVVSRNEQARGWVQAMNPDLCRVVAGKQCTKSVQKFYFPFNNAPENRDY